MLPRLIALDMDGTLLGADGRVSARNLAALHDAEARGVEVVIATGRRHCYAMKVLRDLGLSEHHALVSSNGAVTRTIGAALLHRTHLPLPTAHWLCRELEAFRSALVLTFDAVGPDGEDTRGALVVEDFDELHASVSGWARANEPYIERVDAIESALANGPPIQMMLCGPLDRIHQAEQRLLTHEHVVAPGLNETRHGRLHAATVALHRTVYPERDLAILDILPAGCSKGAALLHLAERRGFHAADILAIGDNWNDVSMLEIAGRAVLMSNAPGELLDMAASRGWIVGAANTEDGVAQAIEAALAETGAVAAPANDTLAMVV